jgi:signal transduction histidine kinase
MTILSVCADDDAMDALSLMLARAGHRVRWTRDAAGADAEWTRDPALVVVIDTAVPNTEALVRRVETERPWTRIVLMLDPRRGLPPILYPAVPKPFDAVELAGALARELDLARSERDRIALERSLEHSERLASVGRIAASMAHEINNPLSGVSAAVEQVAEAAKRSHDADLSECADDLAIAVERIRSFVDHVCGFVRREAPTLANAPLANAVEMALRMVKPRASARRVRVEVEGDPEVVVHHDAPRLSQAVTNLLSNAIDAAPAERGRVTLSISRAGDAVSLCVDDDGPGVDPKLAGKLFEPFATSKPPGAGTGLGLAIARQIVDDHGGVLTLGPRPGGGTRALIRLFTQP